MAHIRQPRVRETSTTEGVGNVVLGGRQRGSLSFAEAGMEAGDTADVVVSYGDTFQEFLATMNADGELVRTTTFRSRHANGDVNAENVSFAPGVKTVIITVAAHRAATLDGAPRYDVAQSLSSGELAQLQANVLALCAPLGTRMTFNQSTAPVGWVKDVDHNDHGMRIVSGTVGTSGSVDYSTLHARTATDARTLTQANLPAGVTLVGTAAEADAHSHTTNFRANTVIVDGGTSFLAQGGSFADHQSSVHPAHAHDVTVSLGGSSTSFTMGLDMRVKTIDLILAERAAP
jgi:hypothetical protein